MLVDIKQVKIPAADALKLDDVVEIYQALRPSMPAGNMGAAKPASRLIDLLDEFDGLVLDGYGVINVGDEYEDGNADGGGDGGGPPGGTNVSLGGADRGAATRAHITAGGVLTAAVASGSGGGGDDPQRI